MRAFNIFYIFIPFLSCIIYKILFYFNFCFPLMKQLATSVFGLANTKIGTIQRRLAWPLRKDDTHYYCYEFKLIYALIVLRGNWVKTDLSVKQCSPIRWGNIIIIIMCGPVNRSQVPKYLVKNHICRVLLNLRQVWTVI